MCSCETTVAMGKGACIKRMVEVRNHSTGTIMEKTNRGGKGWGG